MMWELLTVPIGLLSIIGGAAIGGSLVMVVCTGILNRDYPGRGYDDMQEKSLMWFGIGSGVMAIAAVIIYTAFKMGVMS